MNSGQFTTPNSSPLANIIYLKWLPLPLGWVKIITNASKNPYTRATIMGMVIRDEADSWIYGLRKKLRSQTTLKVELWAIYFVLNSTVKMGFQLIELQSDSNKHIIVTR